MGVKPVSVRELSDTLTLCEMPANSGDAYKAGHRRVSDGVSLAKPGWWLYDDTRGFNLAMRAESPEAAMLEGLQYYQQSLKKVEAERDKLQTFVDSIAALVAPHEDEED